MDELTVNLQISGNRGLPCGIGGSAGVDTLVLWRNIFDPQ